MQSFLSNSVFARLENGTQWYTYDELGTKAGKGFKMGVTRRIKTNG